MFILLTTRSPRPRHGRRRRDQTRTGATLILTLYFPTTANSPSIPFALSFSVQPCTSPPPLPPQPVRRGKVHIFLPPPFTFTALSSFLRIPSADTSTSPGPFFAAFPNLAEHMRTKTPIRTKQRASQIIPAFVGCVWRGLSSIESEGGRRQLAHATEDA